MKKYYVKSLFYGWNEVSKEHYDRFIKHITEHSTALKQKEEYLKTRTKVIDESETIGGAEA